MCRFRCGRGLRGGFGGCGDFGGGRRCFPEFQGQQRPRGDHKQQTQRQYSVEPAPSAPDRKSGSAFRAAGGIPLIRAPAVGTEHEAVIGGWSGVPPLPWLRRFSCVPGNAGIRSAGELDGRNRPLAGYAMGIGIRILGAAVYTFFHDDDSGRDSRENAASAPFF